MYNIFKYKYLQEIQEKYKSSFKLCKSNLISVLPPILKRIGAIYYLAFLVIENELTTTNNDVNNISNINKNNTSNSDSNLNNSNTDNNKIENININNNNNINNSSNINNINNINDSNNNNNNYDCNNSNNKNNNKTNNLFISIKRPIGLILTTLNGKEKIIDFKDFDFSFNNSNFNKIYYYKDTKQDFWPNENENNIERYRIYLDYLQKIVADINFVKGVNKQNYQNYLNKIKTFFPEQYWCFYEDLQRNEILQVDENDLQERKLLSEQSKIDSENEKRRLIYIQNNLKQNFTDKLKKDLITFTYNEILPLLKGKGSYTKLVFFNDLGKYFRDFNKVVNNYKMCYCPIISKEDIDKNILQAIEDENCEIVKIYARATKNPYCKINSIDALSKVMIVFLNALLLEEIHSCVINYAEEEILECKQIFTEDSERIKNEVAKKFLTNIYNELCKDYNTVEEKDLSNIYYAYLLLFNRNYNN